ncbi:MAG: uroporphyrinogen-III C-methyltransferase, partial [Polaromonas sp.]
MNQGKVTLVGAGPGDPELLTLKALKAIQQATVLFVDDLVNDEIVAFAAPGARVVYVGKRGGCKSTPQTFIEKLMLTAAREGENVVRLKGGDPFIFGRGGEEVEHLQAAGITVEVVNGITSGLAAVTSLGVPLTHRQHAHGVVFVTGHAKPGDSGTDWRALAATAHSARLTLVIYMGVSGAERIQ